MCRLSRGGDGDYCLMIYVRIVLVQCCGQAFCLFLLKELCAGPDLPADCGFPMDSVRFHMIRLQNITVCSD
jgi:hypothetical protein